MKQTKTDPIKNYLFEIIDSEDNFLKSQLANHALYAPKEALEFLSTVAIYAREHEMNISNSTSIEKGYVSLLEKHHGSLQKILCNEVIDINGDEISYDKSIRHSSPDYVKIGVVNCAFQKIATQILDELGVEAERLYRNK